MLEAAGRQESAISVPESFGLRLRYALAAFIFFVGYRLLGLRRGVIRGNLQRSFPDKSADELRRIRNDFVRRQSEILAELDYSRALTADELRQRVRLVDPAGLLQGEDRLLVVAGHQCNFEWLLLRLSLELGPDLVCVYKQMNSKRAEDYFTRIRTRFGARLLPSTHIRQELRTIRNARAFGLVADQVPRTSPERHWTTFLHQHTAFFMGPERMARLLRARTVFLSMRRDGRGVYEVVLEPLTAPAEKPAAGETTERYARALERDITADPAGWWWSHKRWKTLRDR
ncbi:MAG: lysophospholipid acyltransferase family protein, partial [Gammaproteobacteria bacterium]|nr:lysophospholipid acyltransferase family protein [Gammaproteobacteria bacterium]